MSGRRSTCPTTCNLIHSLIVRSVKYARCRKITLRTDGPQAILLRHQSTFSMCLGAAHTGCTRIQGRDPIHTRRSEERSNVPSHPAFRPLLVPHLEEAGLCGSLCLASVHPSLHRPLGGGRRAVLERALPMPGEDV